MDVQQSVWSKPAGSGTKGSKETSKGGKMKMLDFCAGKSGQESCFGSSPVFVRTDRTITCEKVERITTACTYVLSAKRSRLCCMGSNFSSARVQAQISDQNKEKFVDLNHAWAGQNFPWKRNSALILLESIPFCMLSEPGVLGCQLGLCWVSFLVLLWGWNSTMESYPAVKIYEKGSESISACQGLIFFPWIWLCRVLNLGETLRWVLVVAIFQSHRSSKKLESVWLSANWQKIVLFFFLFLFFFWWWESTLWCDSIDHKWSLVLPNKKLVSLPTPRLALLTQDFFPSDHFVCFDIWPYKVPNFWCRILHVPQTQDRARKLKLAFSAF